MSSQSPHLSLYQNICEQLDEAFHFKTSPKTCFEGDVSFNHLVSIECDRIARVKIDAYSFISPRGRLFDTEIGRYTSIADCVYTGLTNISSQSVTTSLVLTPSSPFADYLGFAPTISSESLISLKEDQPKIVIGHDVWIGCNVSISEPVSIGTGAVLGAGATITQDVEPYAVVVGHNRKVKSRFKEEMCADLLDSQWWKYDIPKMLASGVKVPFQDPQQFLQFLQTAKKSDLIELEEHWQKMHLLDDERFEVNEI